LVAQPAAARTNSGGVLALNGATGASISIPTDNTQQSECETAGGNSAITASCNNTFTITGGRTPITPPTPPADVGCPGAQYDVIIDTALTQGSTTFPAGSTVCLIQQGNDVHNPLGEHIANLAFQATPTINVAISNANTPGQCQNAQQVHATVHSGQNNITPSLTEVCLNPHPEIK
jgi:hypothetical protein